MTVAAGPETAAFAPAPAVTAPTVAASREGAVMAILLALGQLAVLWPALRAASVPPAEATRAV